MKILGANEIRNWDQYTIENEPISSVGLMERAATVFTYQLRNDFPDNSHPVIIFCGTGNNGGDGLVIGRLLSLSGYEVIIYIVSSLNDRSKDFQFNLNRIPKRQGIQVIEISNCEEFSSFPINHIIVDALFGTGLNRPLNKFWNELINKINRLSNCTISVDIPSGMHADNYTQNEIIRADFTYTFQIPKLMMLFDESHQHTGKWKILDIGLNHHFIQEISTPYCFVDIEMIKAVIQKRKDTDHKGVYGHALLVTGSNGKIGASILSAEACLRSGAGLLTVRCPKIGVTSLQTACPEAMLDIDSHEDVISKININKDYSAIGIGCGIGENNHTINALTDFLKNSTSPIVLDADALNIIANKKTLIDRIPKDSIITPHPKEFARLFGLVSDPKERLELQIKMSIKYEIFIAYKGHFTRITTPTGVVYFNSTGNHGMATAGSGDVLTGIITGLLAQRYTSEYASALGVYIHGLSGDIAADKIGHHALLARDIIESIGFSYLTILS